YSADGIESGTSNWILTGFTQSTSKKHAGTYSLYSGSQDNIANTAQTKYPYIVQPNDTFSFWFWNYSENDYDVTIVEVSEDEREWIQLDTRYSGSQQTWTQKKYSLSQWEGKAVYFRFRTITDDNTLHDNFYVDDISPVASFSQIEVLDSVIYDTSYTPSTLPLGENYFRVRGHNTRGWGNYSNTVKTVVVQPNSVEEPAISTSVGTVSVLGNSRDITIKYSFTAGQDMSVKVFDATGRMVGDYNYQNLSGQNTISITPSSEGVLFVRINSGDIEITEKALIIR
ncbi:immune inhibitor A, partial [candidate division WOR-3 bacterium]|nr:immune inhibitor A [candidate division WOR-3 bacterium]